MATRLRLTRSTPHLSWESPRLFESDGSFSPNLGHPFITLTTFDDRKPLSLLSFVFSRTYTHATFILPDRGAAVIITFL